VGPLVLADLLYGGRPLVPNPTLPMVAYLLLVGIIIWGRFSPGGRRRAAAAQKSIRTTPPGSEAPSFERILWRIGRAVAPSALPAMRQATRSVVVAMTLLIVLGVATLVTGHTAAALFVAAIGVAMCGLLALRIMTLPRTRR